MEKSLKISPFFVYINITTKTYHHDNKKKNKTAIRGHEGSNS
jgi:hypothetical protein